MEQLNQLIIRVNDFVWGPPMIILILLTGILLTFRLKLLQVFRLPLALYYMIRNEERGRGEVSSLAALCTALSATVGTGNIVGVATAVVAGGPGAIFWMWIAAFWGMATKFAEGLLAVKYRIVRPDNTILGGPFYYIEKGLGPRWKFLAVLFAIFGATAAIMGIGTLAQIHSITSAIQNVFDRNSVHLLRLGFIQIPQCSAIAGLCVTVLAGMVIIGGLKRIAFVSQFLVPFMILIYLLMTGAVLIVNFKLVPDAIRQILLGAFQPSAVTGGAIGSIIVVMQKGIARGIFSNESGLGSAPIVAATAQTHFPARQGLVSMTGTFIDTIVICTMTGLVIVTMSSWNIGLDGIAVTSSAFEKGLPFLGPETSACLLMTCLIFFAFTTTLGWSYYGERCLDYLVKGRKKWILLYRWMFIFVIFISPYMTLKFVWNMADIFNGLMAFPNLLALIVLSGTVARETATFFKIRENPNIFEDLNEQNTPESGCAVLVSDGNEKSMGGK